MNAAPAFLTVPEPARPSPARGLTHVLDKGLPVAEVEPLLAVCGRVHRHLEVRLGHRLPRPGPARRSSRCCAGTACWPAPAAPCSRSPGSRAWPSTWTGRPSCRLPVRRGVLRRRSPSTRREKRELIAAGRRRFVVLAEVGAKDPGRGCRRPSSGRRRPRPTSTPERPGWSPRAGRAGRSGLSTADGRSASRSSRRVVDAVGVEHASVRGAAQGAAGVADPPLRRRREPRQHRHRARRSALETLRLGLRADTFDVARLRRRVTGRRRPMTQRLPERYREVSVADVDVPARRGRAARAAHFAAGLPPDPLHRRRATAARPRWSRSAGWPTTGAVLTPSTTVALLAGPARRAYVHRRTSTPASPAQLARPPRDAPRRALRRRRGPLRPRQLRPRPGRRCGCTVLDVVPPWPAKLLDQAQRVLRPGRGPARRSSWSPTSSSWTTCVPPGRSATTCCRAAAVAWRSPARPRVLSRRGADRGATGRCSAARGREQIHEWFYGERAAQVDICPRTLAPRRPPARCC